MASADTIQQLEDLLERIGALQASLKKLTTESVSRPALKKESHAIHKTWLPIFGVLEDDANFSGGRLERRMRLWRRCANCKAMARYS